jgi:hypothetical protein
MVAQRSGLAGVLQPRPDCGGRPVPQPARRHLPIERGRKQRRHRPLRLPPAGRGCRDGARREPADHGRTGAGNAGRAVLVYRGAGRPVVLRCGQLAAKLVMAPVWAECPGRRGWRYLERWRPTGRAGLGHVLHQHRGAGECGRRSLRLQPVQDHAGIGGAGHRRVGARRADAARRSGELLVRRRSTRLAEFRPIVRCHRWRAVGAVFGQRPAGRLGVAAVGRSLPVAGVAGCRRLPAPAGFTSGREHQLRLPPAVPGRVGDRGHRRRPDGADRFRIRARG